MRNRAAVVSLHDDRLLVIRRQRQGSRYAVLPGGGVEPGESVTDAALRELHEETGLSGEVIAPLWTLEHADCVADYVRVAVPLAPMIMSGPETRTMSPDNSYEPCWIKIADLDLERLEPAEIRPLIRTLAGVRSKDRET